MSDLTIYAIKTKLGFYISEEPSGDRYASTSLTKYFFDGTQPESTWHKNWAFVPDEPEQIQQLERVPSTNHRYELIDKSLPGEKYPPVLPYDDVTEDDGDYGRRWKGEYAHMQSLYKKLHDDHDPVMVDVTFSFAIVLKLDGLADFAGTEYPVRYGRHDEHTGFVDATGATSQLLDKILFPAIVLPSRPCKLTSEQSYMIVREHIKQNINLEWAEITGDYNFCFTVKKRVRLWKPVTRRIEIKTARGKSYKKPRYREEYIKNRAVTVFEMTHSPKPYKGYTPIAGFRGESWQDLERNIDKYLAALMEIINAPLVDCPNCNGMGVIEKETKNSDIQEMVSGGRQ